MTVHGITTYPCANKALPGLESELSAAQFGRFERRGSGPTWSAESDLETGTLGGTQLLFERPPADHLVAEKYTKINIIIKTLVY